MTTEVDLTTRYPGATFGQMVQIIGLDSVRIGAGSVVGDHSWLNVCVRDGATRLTIGRRVLVGRESMLSTAGSLEIGDYCLFGPRVFVADADHVYANIAKPYMDQGVTAGRVVVEENCWLGIHAVVSGSLTVGRGSVVAANAVVTRDVPPFTVVAGVPARPIKMYNPESSAWESVTAKADLDRVMAARQMHPLPSRTEYLQILRRTTASQTISPLVAGRGACL